ncbi:Pr6Pr family membrane protein [Actinophytocola sp.]|jgi:hypothetical protein|uniref:Pr6Pr family membrane protein n=1 Tax=Actinophytocola sp. TaxID=1872138 RepID=UPI002EDA7D52
MRHVVAGYRLVFGLLALGTVVYLATQVPSLPNLLSYFTVLSNVFGAGVLLVGAFRPVPDLVRGAAALYLGMTGLVFALLLSGADLGLLEPWANSVLHHVLPVVAVLDWLLVPPRRGIPMARSLWWLAFPAAYLAYTLVRGAIVDWYPYPFLDPRPRGYPHVITMSVGIAVAFGVAALAVGWAGNRRRATVPA